MLAVPQPGARLDGSLAWEDLAELRRRWPGRLLIKGLLRAADARRAVAMGVDGVVVSNHEEGLIGAGRHERSGERTTYRNGYRDRALDTRLGSLQLRIPKLRQGSYFPGGFSFRSEHPRGG